MPKKETMVKKTSFSLKRNAGMDNTSQTSTQAVKHKSAVVQTNEASTKGWSKEWRKFLATAEDMKREATIEDKGVQIWLDTRLKRQLEMLRASGLNYPVRQLLNAAVKTFLGSCSDDVKKQLENLQSID
jgi:hypothetical protein